MKEPTTFNTNNVDTAYDHLTNAASEVVAKKRRWWGVAHYEKANPDLSDIVDKQQMEAAGIVAETKTQQLRLYAQTHLDKQKAQLVTTRAQLSAQLAEDTQRIAIQTLDAMQSQMTKMYTDCDLEMKDIENSPMSDLMKNRRLENLLTDFDRRCKLFDQQIERVTKDLTQFTTHKE